MNPIDGVMVVQNHGEMNILVTAVEAHEMIIQLAVNIIAILRLSAKFAMIHRNGPKMEESIEVSVPAMAVMSLTEPENQKLLMKETKMKLKITLPNHGMIMVLM